MISFPRLCFFEQLHPNSPGGDSCERTTQVIHTSKIYPVISRKVILYKKCFPKICAQAIVIFVVAEWKLFLPFATPISVCSGAIWFPHELVRKTYQRVTEQLSFWPLVTSQIKSYSQKMVTQSPPIKLSVWLHLIANTIGKLPLSVSSFNQMAKHWEHPGHHSWRSSALLVPLVEGLGWRLPCSCPRSVPCVPGCTSPATAKNNLQGDSADLLSPGPLLPAGKVFVLMKKMFMKSTHQSYLFPRTIWVIK